MSVPPSETPHDAIVIGGGFYGATIATYLRTQRGLDRVMLIEAEPELLTRASYTNQARIHNGYHYPRSFTTGYRSRINLPRFVRDYPAATKRDFTKIYAIASRNSKVTARQFERFCADIGAKLTKAPPSIAAWFDPRLIEASYLVEEYAFDATALRRHAEAALRDAGVEVLLGSRVLSAASSADGVIELGVATAGGSEGGRRARARRVFNCTYSGLNRIGAEPGCAHATLKHEITEMALVDVPPELREFGVTVMDGPFFSCMPFPARGLHTLSHVRYTPLGSWIDEPAIDPRMRLAALVRETRGDRMRRDAERYMPLLGRVRQVDSLYEVKTVLASSEVDDGRPILFEESETLPGFYFVLGGKIDNVYDIVERLDREGLG